MAVPLPDRRHRALAVASIVLALALGAPALAVEGVAVVDYQAIFDAYEGTSDAQRTLDRELKDWDTEAQQMRDLLQVVMRCECPSFSDCAGLLSDSDLT